MKKIRLPLVILLLFSMVFFLPNIFQKGGVDRYYYYIVPICFVLMNFLLEEKKIRLKILLSVWIASIANCILYVYLSKGFIEYFLNGKAFVIESGGWRIAINATVYLLAIAIVYSLRRLLIKNNVAK